MPCTGKVPCAGRACCTGKGVAATCVFRNPKPMLCGMQMPLEQSRSFFLVALVAAFLALGVVIGGITSCSLVHWGGIRNLPTHLLWKWEHIGSACLQSCRSTCNSVRLLGLRDSMLLVCHGQLKMVWVARWRRLFQFCCL